jgi:hypothetical protein
MDAYSSFRTSNPSSLESERRREEEDDEEEEDLFVFNEPIEGPRAPTHDSGSRSSPCWSLRGGGRRKGGGGGGFT